MFGVMLACGASAQPTTTTFEMRHIKNDVKANGVTDFHGETEVLNTEQRVEALNRYADYASKFWGDAALNTPMFTDDEVRARVAQIKPQPTTSVRRTILLDSWQAYGHKADKAQMQTKRWAEWSAKGATISDGRLLLNGAVAAPAIDTIDWRFRIKCWLNDSPAGLKISFEGDGASDIEVVLSEDKVKAQSGQKSYSTKAEGLKYFEIYGDLECHRIFLTSAEQTLLEFPIGEDFGRKVLSFAMSAEGGKASVDKFSLYSFVRNPENKRMPFSTKLHYDEEFNDVPSMEDWTTASYDDSQWERVSLPAAHGGQNVAGESYYLRTKVKVGNFKYAELQLEAVESPPWRRSRSAVCRRVADNLLSMCCDIVSRYAVVG